MTGQSARKRYRRSNPEVSVSAAAYERVRVAALARGVTKNQIVTEIVTAKLDKIQNGDR